MSGLLHQISTSSLQRSMVARDLARHLRGMVAVRDDRYLLRRFSPVQALLPGTQYLQMMPQFPSHWKMTSVMATTSSGPRVQQSPASDMA